MRYEQEAKKIIDKVLNSIKSIKQPKDWLIGMDLIETIDKMIEDVVTSECKDCEYYNDTLTREPEFNKEDLD